MKSAALIFALFAISATSAWAGVPNDLLCRQNAVRGAEQAYGNDPFRVNIKTIRFGMYYQVTVGIGNPEDGAHLYDVTFKAGCASQPLVQEAPLVPIHPLQPAVHAVYSRLVSYSQNLPEQAMVPPQALPVQARPLYMERQNTLNALMQQWGVNNLRLTVYRIPVANQMTYAIWVPNLHDSIRAYFYVVDSVGRDIDDAAVYGEPDVGQNGVTWQNEEVER